MKIKSFHHVCIQTSDETYDASLQFYKDLLGFKIIKENEDFQERGHNTWLEASQMKIELQTPKRGEQFKTWDKNNSGPVHLAFVVENVQATHRFFKEKGYKNFKVKNGLEVYPVNNGQTMIMKVIAPEGTEVEIRDSQEI